MGLFGRSKESEAATEQALERTRRSWFGRLGDVLRGSDVGPELWDSLEEVLIGADTGVETTFEVLARVRAGDPSSADEVRERLRSELIAILEGPDGHGALWGPGAAAEPPCPAVVLVVGVNGTGKTTVIARLAYAYGEEDKRVLAAAGDTFRAAAISQLRSWGERLDFDVIAHQPGADPAAVAFDAAEAAQARGHDLLLVDTAGRLHNKHHLMDELTKIRRVIERQLGRGPDEVVLVLDATTGQNGLAQARAFTEAVEVTSVIITKLDGSARGGIVFAVASQLGLPVRFIGTGDGPGDLAPFEPVAFVDALLTPSEGAAEIAAESTPEVAPQAAEA